MSALPSPARVQPVFGFENAKTVKGRPLGWVTAIRYLAPSTVAARATRAAGLGAVNTCVNAGACRAFCLYTAGRGRFAEIQEARIRKTVNRYLDPRGHLEQAAHEIENAVARAGLAGLKLAVRVNGTSDLAEDATALAERFPRVQFYDYTKRLDTAERFVSGDLPKNYHVTLSHDAVTMPWGITEGFRARGMNVAVITQTGYAGEMVSPWVVDGDAHDLRFLRRERAVSGLGRVVILKAKGKAKGAP